MRKFIKATEMETISSELLDEIYPMDTLQKFYWLDMAETLNTFNKIANSLNESLTIEEFKYLISHYVNSHEKITEYYNRLQKDNK